MPGRIAIVLRVAVFADPQTGTLQVSNLDTMAPLEVEPLSFVLTLEREADVTFSRGQIRSLDGAVSYPIQSSAAMFEALSQYVARAGRAP
ncbi:MAG TPA: hypothetical protein VGM69_08415 [Chloroflexota bacterium]|jgi:hypothetical protein